METQAKTGINRTGIAMSPFDIEDMMDFPMELDEVADPTLVRCPIREEYLDEAGVLGSVPLPLTAKGLLESGKALVTGDHPSVFIDKLGERLAFERSGVRLYQALLDKCIAAEAQDLLPEDAIEKLRHFQQEELQHFELLAEAMRSIGADPTAETPSADFAGVESQGLMLAIRDPRTTLTQSLHVILAAELIDAPGWEDIVALADALGHKDLSAKFTEALREENVHLRAVQLWYSQMTLAGATGESPLPTS